MRQSRIKHWKNDLHQNATPKNTLMKRFPRRSKLDTFSLCFHAMNSATLFGVVRVNRQKKPAKWEGEAKQHTITNHEHRIESERLKLLRDRLLSVKISAWDSQQLIPDQTQQKSFPLNRHAFFIAVFNGIQIMLNGIMNVNPHWLHTIVDFIIF